MQGELTKHAWAISFAAMSRTIATIMAAGSVMATGGCVNVSAPDKPIVINLNINVTQEVVYRLDSRAKSLIQNNPDIF